MIDDFDNGEFERTLKEQADSFFLMPSERVWKSIYNDLHPGSKWPSLAVGVFLLLTLFWIGNSDNSTFNDGVSSPEKLLSPNSLEKNNSSREVPLFNNNKNLEPGLNSRPNKGGVLVENSTLPQLNQEIEVSGIHTDIPMPGSTAKVVRFDKYPKKSEPATLETTSPDIQTTISRTPPDPIQDISMNAEPVGLPHYSGNTVVLNDQESSHLSLSKLIRNAKVHKWEYFFSPIISNVYFGGTNLNKTNSSVIYSPVSKHNMDIAKRLGFITGINYYYPLTNRISFTTGAHLVYTGYNIYSQLTRPNIASLTFRDSKGEMFSKSYISYYANETNRRTTNITNYNWQLSVPVGLQWDILSNENIKISVVSTIEPFMVLGSNAYLLSGDASSYVKDPELIRRFNLSGNIGSVVTFSSNNVNWKIGPNFRYQVLSTYNNIYPVKEHFVNYGIHVGVSRK